jgi:hypothetical protein
MFLAVIKDRHIDEQYLLTHDIHKAKLFITEHFNGLASADKFTEIQSDEYEFLYRHNFEIDEGFVLYIEADD